MTAGVAEEDEADLTHEPSATDRAYSAILNNALTGSYRAGERLTEARLTAELALSRIPVREALKRLALEGVIDLHRHRGATVRVMSRRDMAEFFQARGMLESQSAAVAAGRIGESSCDEERARLVAQMAQLRRWVGAEGCCDKEQYADHNQQFHRLIVELSGNRLLLKMWGSLQLPVQRLKFFGRYRPADIRISIDDHSRIAEAILAGDSESAARFARNHVNRVAAALYELSDVEFDLVLNPGVRSSPVPQTDDDSQPD